MPLPEKITVPEYPRFLPAPDQYNRQLYIICTSPLALIWVRQTVPGQLYIVEGPQDENLLKDAADWYRDFAANQMDKN